MASCNICNKLIESEEDQVKLGEKGAEGINNASQLRGHDVMVEPGDFVHISCRKRYVNRARIHSSSTQEEQASTSTRSRTNTFNFRTNCFLCGDLVTSKEKREKKISNVICKNKEVDNAIEKCIKDRNDEWATAVNGRLASVMCLRAEEAIYHLLCNTRFRNKKENTKISVIGKKRGRPSDISSETAFLAVANYFEDNDEEQLTINDLVTMMDSMLPGEENKTYSPKWMQQKLLDHFQGQIVISNVSGKPNVVTFQSTANKILNDFKNEKDSMDSEEEKIRLIKAAAKLLKNDIKALPAQLKYPTIEEIGSLECCIEYLPLSLRVLLEDMFVGKNNSLKLAFIGQAMMQQVRPRAILTPLQVGVAVQMHHQFASRFLNDSLNAMGFACSYTEVSKFERNAAVMKGIDIYGIKDGAFGCLQHIGDNADHNIRTLDGLNTFHGMGIVATLTPGQICTQRVPRLTVTPDEIVKIGSLEKQVFFTREKVLHKIKFEILVEIKSADPTDILGNLWKCTWILKSQRPLWNGFMQMVHKKEKHPGKASVIFLPMIDMPATDMSCILSTMEFVSKQAREYDQTPILTFDQPLYWKAIEIQMWEKDESPLNEIILLLGHFHTRMSFLGSIGHLMTASGLESMLKLVYAENTVPHMMTGKAYSRAIRGLLLVTASLYGHIMSMVYDCEIVPTTVNEDHTETTKQFDTLLCLDSCEELKNCSDIMDNIIAEDRELNDDEQSIIQGILVKMQDFRNNLATSKTAQLWFQFLDMTEIMCKSIKAQRTGNWLLHLESVYEMLPYFAASGHYLYAKSAYLYLQKMSKLETSHPVIYRKFKVEGLHVIRRSERYWGGLSSDLIIEQVLMRSMKTSGGLTRGRGMTDIQRTLWLLSSPTCASFNEALQGMTGIQFHTSEQHKESGESRLLKDYNDACIITRYINERTPFVISNDFFSLETGEVADSKVNVYQAKTIGEEILKGMVGIPVLEYSFKKKHMAVIMKSKSTITVDDEAIPVDPQLLFQRLLATAKAKNSLELEEVFHYEMSTVPTSLFGEDFLMRDANKPQLGDAIWKFAGPGAETLPNGCRYVLDGGALLSRIQTWKRGMTFESICQIYKDYVIRHYGNETTVVFDGGYEIPSTKDSEHLRRRKGKLGKQVNFNKQMKLSMKKDDFLLNNSNKQRFLEMLTEIMNDGPLTAMQAPCDADYQIVMTALNLSKF